jgi:BirA family transcriptional regulator, biotin operon repressor / biotin---[acetyl-CoA-carboxylase] ligase
LKVILLNSHHYKKIAMLLVGKTLLEFPSLDSTNEYCKKIAGSQETAEGTVVWTASQFKGRGQGKNTWESEDGQNLTFSVILRPVFMEPAEQFYLSMVASLGIAGWLNGHIKGVCIKWPNDIYAGNRKIAGILIENSVIENRISHSVIGIGVNINQTRFGDHLPNPVSLKQITSRSFSLRDALDQICSQLESWYLRLKRGRRQEIKNHYTRQLLWLNEKHACRAGSKTYQAYIRGVDDFGRLALEDEKGVVRHFGFKEVEFPG